jgi:hypothetical protein
MLNTYDEYGPENICYGLTAAAALEKAMRLSPLDEDQLAGFNRVIADPATRLNDAYNLGHGWGGWQLTILDADF